MSNPKLLVGLLIAALGLADAALLAPALMGSYHGPNGAGIIYYGLLFGQVSLCGIYSALAQAHFVLRGLLLGAALTLTPLLLQPLHGDLVQLCMLVSVQLLCIVLPLTAIRGVAGVRLAWLTPVSLSDATSREMSRPLQFSLMHIMIAVTAIAVMLGVARGLHALTPYWITPGMIWELGLIAASLAVVGLAATWSGLGTGSLLLRGAVFLLIMGVVAGGVWFYFREGPDQILAIIITITAIELAFALSVLRIAGFRLVRRRGRSPVARMEM